MNNPLAGTDPTGYASVNNTTGFRLQSGTRSVSYQGVPILAERKGGGAAQSNGGSTQQTSKPHQFSGGITADIDAQGFSNDEEPIDEITVTEPAAEGGGGSFGSEAFALGLRTPQGRVAAAGLVSVGYLAWYWLNHSFALNSLRRPTYESEYTFIDPKAFAASSNGNNDESAPPGGVDFSISGGTASPSGQEPDDEESVVNFSRTADRKIRKHIDQVRNRHGIKEDIPTPGRGGAEQVKQIIRERVAQGNGYQSTYGGESVTMYTDGRVVYVIRPNNEFWTILRNTR